MLGFRCANPAIIRDVEPGPRQAKRFIHAVRPVDEIDLVLLRGFHQAQVGVIRRIAPVGSRRSVQSFDTGAPASDGSAAE